MPKKVIAIVKHGVIHYVQVTPILEIEGLIPELNTENLRDKIDRNC